MLASTVLRGIQTVARTCVKVGRVDHPDSQVRINRIRTALAAFKVSLQADKIEPPTRCRAGKAVVRPLEASVGKRQHRIAAVRPQIECDRRPVKGGQPRRDHPPAHMGLRRELVYLDLDDELMFVETEFARPTDRRIKGSVACPPVPNALGSSDRLIHLVRRGVDSDEMHDVGHSAVPFWRSTCVRQRASPCTLCLSCDCRFYLCHVRTFSASLIKG